MQGLMPSITIFSTYRYIKIFLFFIVTRDDACTIIFVFIVLRCSAGIRNIQHRRHLLFVYSFWSENFYICTQKNLFLDGRRGQGIKGITWNTNEPKMTLKTFYVPFLLEPIECMYTIRVVQFLYYEPMMQILCHKPPSFLLINRLCILAI